MFNSFQVHKEPQLSCLVLCTVFDMFVAWCHTKARSSFCLGKNMRFLIFLVIFWQTSGWNILFEFLIDDLDQSKSKSNNYLFFVLLIYNFQNNFHIYHTLIFDYCHQIQSYNRHIVNLPFLLFLYQGLSWRTKLLVQQT